MLILFSCIKVKIVSYWITGLRLKLAIGKTVNDHFGQNLVCCWFLCDPFLGDHPGRTLRNYLFTFSFLKFRPRSFIWALDECFFSKFQLFPIHFDLEVLKNPCLELGAQKPSKKSNPEQRDFLPGGNFPWCNSSALLTNVLRALWLCFLKGT